MSNNKPILYSYWRSSCSWRVRAVLELKKIPYEYRPVNLFSGEQNEEKFRSINPFGLVPVLMVPNVSGDGHETLFESLAIINYLEQTNPEPSIYPKNTIQRAKVAGIVEFIVCDIQPLQNLGTMRKAAEFGGSPNKGVEWNRYWITTKFKQLEQILHSLSGKYSVGDQFSLADICLVPQVYNALRYNIDMNEYPTIKRLFEQLLANEESIIKSHPDKQVDSDAQKKS